MKFNYDKEKVENAFFDSVIFNDYGYNSTNKNHRKIQYKQCEYCEESRGVQEFLKIPCIASDIYLPSRLYKVVANRFLFSDICINCKIHLSELKKIANDKKAVSRNFAYNIFLASLKEGTLIRSNICEWSNLGGCSEKIEAHHSDYTKPCDILWLCTKHHKAWHKEHKPLYHHSYGIDLLAEYEINKHYDKLL